MSLQSIRTTRVRSLLTTVGVVIGVASVVLAVNVGQGVKQQVNGQIDSLGGNLISVRSGRVVIRDDQGQIERYSLNQALSSATLTTEDLEQITSLPSVEAATPLAEFNADIKSITDAPFQDGHVLGVAINAPDLLGREVVFGNEFTDRDRPQSAILGIEVAEELYGDPSPIGRIVRLKGKDFIIKGVFERFPTSPLTIGVDYNRAVFTPFTSAEALGIENPPIREILVKAESSEVESTITTINDDLLEAHGQEDFSVLKQADLIFITDSVFSLITGLVAAVAAISLIVGGIGIMNIMLASVAERTREIGIRKAIGASNLHIMGQFLTEAIVMSVIGGLIGVTLAEIGGLVIRSTTDIRPVFDLQVVLIAISVSVAVGVIFGVGPAWKAARKKPIEALRS